MVSTQYEKYELLKDEEGRLSEGGSSTLTGESFDPAEHQSPPWKNRSRWPSTSLIIAFAFSALANLVSAVVIFCIILRQSNSGTDSTASLDSSLYGKRWSNKLSTDEYSFAAAGLTRDPFAQFPYSIGYGPEITNHSLADERWESIDIDVGIVAVSKTWASEHNLPPSQAFPWDTSKGVYALTAFHTLHCLKNIHRLLYDAHHNRPLSRDIGHAMHCLDHIRKDTMCNADDYLLSSPPDKYGHEGPRGQARVCKNWDQLVEWAKDNHACYRHMSDDEVGFAENHEEIERYYNCPAGSPYEERMKKYIAARDSENKI